MAKWIGIAVGVIGAALVAAFVFGSDSPPSSSIPVILAGTSSAPALVVPSVTAEKVTGIATSTAILRGVVQPNGQLTTFWFEYSADPRVGSVLAKSTPRIALATTTGSVDVAVRVSDLMPSTTYYYRLVADSPAGTVRSDPLSFLGK